MTSAQVKICILNAFNAGVKYARNQPVEKDRRAIGEELAAKIKTALDKARSEGIAEGWAQCTQVNAMLDQWERDAKR